MDRMDRWARLCNLKERTSMAKKNTNLSESLRQIKNDIKADNVKRKFGIKLPSILEFVEEEKWLGFAHYPNPITLYPFQQIMLKCFYRNSDGNKDLKLTTEEIQMIKDSGLDDESAGDLLEKWDNDEVFRELVLVWGRRSGKDFIVSIVALYEAMRLLETPGGNPYATYNLGQAAPMTILTIANSSAQAKILFREMRQKIQMSPYFDDKVGKITDDRIYLLTPSDKEANKRNVEKGLPTQPGSVQIVAGHSNSSSLVGLSCFAIIFDEIGIYKNTAGSSSGDQLYHNLTPATKTYVRKEFILDDKGDKVLLADGTEETKSVMDGRVICISTPRGKEGIFYDLYSKSHNVDHRFMMKAPTWVINPHLPKSLLLAESPEMSDSKFGMEYGAEFFGTAGEAFFPRDKIEDCFKRHHLKIVNHGQPGYTYFAHLDPATSSHNYALAIVHQESFFNEETQRMDFRVVADHIAHWTPMGERVIPVEEVDNYVIEMNKRFHLGEVTYDLWNSKESIYKLRKQGIPAKQTPFTRQYKQEIYDNMYQLIISNRLLIPRYKLLENEMINLQRRWMGNSYKVMPKIDSDCNTDDIIDALAGACYNISQKTTRGLPLGKLVDMPVSPQSGAITWRSMQGTPYGTGSGSKVAKDMANRSGAHPFNRPN